MLRLLRFLIFGDGHIHHWRRIADGKLTNGERFVGNWYDCECTVCGAHKRFNCAA